MISNYERNRRFRWCQIVIENHGLVLSTRNILLFEKIWDNRQAGDQEKVMAVVKEIQEMYGEDE